MTDRKEAKNRRSYTPAVIDRSHPEAGRGGVVPPSETRFLPPGGPGTLKAVLQARGRPSRGSSSKSWSGS